MSIIIIYISSAFPLALQVSLNSPTPAPSEVFCSLGWAQARLRQDPVCLRLPVANEGVGIFSSLNPSNFQLIL